MTQSKKQEILASITALLSKLLDEEETPLTNVHEPPVEMLTIK